MDLLLISGLTVLALLALALEFFTRALSHGLASFREWTSAAGLPQEMAEPMPAVAAPSVKAVPWSYGAAEASAGATDAGSRRATSAHFAAPEPEPAGQSRTAEGIKQLVRHLEALESAIQHARTLGDLMFVFSDIEDQLFQYSLDDVLEISDYDLGVSAIAYYRGVASSVAQIRVRFERLPQASAPDSAEPLIESDRAHLRRVAAEEIVRGTRLADRLGGYSQKVAPALTWNPAVVVAHSSLRAVDAQTPIPSG